MGARLGYEDSKGVIHSVYVHWDTFPENLGPILTRRYQKYFLVKDMVDRGDISRIHQNGEVSHYAGKFGSVDEERWQKYKPKKAYSIPMWLQNNPDKVFFYLYTRNKWILILQGNLVWKIGDTAIAKSRIDLSYYKNGKPSIDITEDFRRTLEVP